MRLIVLTIEKEAARLAQFVRQQCPDVDLVLITGKTDSPAAVERHVTTDSILVTFSTGVIIPENLLKRLERKNYNFHAGSPEYPGRDVHHFAVYYGTSRYGATAHELAARVDAGPIVGVEWFDVPSGMGPQTLRMMAVEAAHRLFERLIPIIVNGTAIAPIGVEWGARKWTRKDFHAMCRIDPSMDQAEFERRHHAFDGGQYDNLTVEHFGHVFRIEKSPR